MHKVCLYYTAHRHPPEIEAACRAQLDAARGDIPLVAVGLERFDYGDVTVVLPYHPGPLTLHRQILAGLEVMWSDTEWVYFCENDVLYHPSHFATDPKMYLSFTYNANVWKVRYGDGHCVWTDGLEQTSGLVAHRGLLLAHYRRRCVEIERDGWNRHYEPGRKTSEHGSTQWHSHRPNLDIRHGRNATLSKWSPEEFRNERYAAGWKEADEVPGWGLTAPLMEAIREGRYAPIGMD